VGVWEYGSMGVWRKVKIIFHFHTPILPYFISPDHGRDGPRDGNWKSGEWPSSHLSINHISEALQ